MVSGRDIPFDSLLQVLLGVIEFLLQELDLALRRIIRLLRRFMFGTGALSVFQLSLRLVQLALRGCKSMIE